MPAVVNLRICLAFADQSPEGAFDYSGALTQLPGESL